MSVTKRVRMSEEEANRLGKLAALDGKTESEVMREGILAYERARRRDAAWEELITMAERDERAPRSRPGGFR